jgi:hypothetical protein
LIQAAAAIAEQHELGCPDKCGDISIPYPFGMKPGCFRQGFQVTCDNSSKPPRAFLAKGAGSGAAQSTFLSSYSITKTGNYSIVDHSDKSNMDIRPVELIEVSVGKSEARVYGAVASA